MPLEQNLMPIGRFSKSCRLSIKALRHYDEQGLLKPAYVDPLTGYRYYARGQARDAVMIGMLRSLGISIATIGTLMQSEGERLRNLLAHERDRIVREQAKMQQALRSIERIAREGELMPYDVAVRDEPAYTVLQKSCTTTSECMIEDGAALVYAVIGELQAAGRPLLDPVMCINEDPDAEERIVVHACVGIEPPYPEFSQSAVIEIPAGPVAWLTHQGPYEELGLAYHALFAWAQEQGYEQAGAMREIYRNDPAEVSVDQLITEVMLPVRFQQG